MKQIKPQDIFKIASPGISTCATVYANTPSELTSLIGEVQRLAQVDLTAKEVAELTAPITFLANSKKWKRKSESIGVFVTKGFAGYMGLPFEVKNLAVVANSFHVKPLIKWIQREKPFFALKLNADEPTLYQGSLSELRVIEQYQFKKARNIESIYEKLDKELNKVIFRSKQPLVLIGDSIHTDVFKTVSQYGLIINKTLSEAAFGHGLRELHKNCLQILEPYLEHHENVLIQKYWSAKLQRKVSSNLNEIVEMALRGQVKHLFVNEKMNVWGQIDYRTGKFSYHAKQQDSFDDDILDDLAEIVLYHKGQVTVLDSNRMPDSQAAAAILKSSQAIQPWSSNKNYQQRRENEYVNNQ